MLFNEHSKDLLSLIQVEPVEHIFGYLLPPFYAHQKVLGQITTAFRFGTLNHHDLFYSFLDLAL